jgi:hypothetical protein
MTKKIMFLGLAVLLVASFGVFAQDTSNQSNQPSQQTPDQNSTPGMSNEKAAGATVTGKVDKIDKDKKTITVKDEATGQKKTLSFNDTTTWKSGTNSAAATDLKKGDMVTVTVDSYNMITNVDITSATGAPSSQTPPQPH